MRATFSPSGVNVTPVLPSEAADSSKVAYLAPRLRTSKAIFGVFIVDIWKLRFVLNCSTDWSSFFSFNSIVASLNLRSALVEATLKSNMFAAIWFLTLACFSLKAIVLSNCSRLFSNESILPWYCSSIVLYASASDFFWLSSFILILANSFVSSLSSLLITEISSA